ncbi:MAG: amino acid ABC transporter permease [Puniceicoccales bacterium]|jgi:polar amino acid transport system permease protein|nr:amino acid ABC transporter permease [Puniceicoccales bacterium]
MGSPVNVGGDLLFVGGGLALTFALLAGGLALGFFLGLSLAILRHCSVFPGAIDRYISFVRGTPMLLQLSLIYFAAPAIGNIRLGVVQAGIVAFGLNSSAYLAEIFRAGIGSISIGQFEAVRTLRIPQFYAWRDIFLPQVFAKILPALTGEVIALLKETALIATIGGSDVMRRSQMVAAERFTYFAPLCMACIYYYAVVLLLEWLGKRLERRVRHAIG